MRERRREDQMLLSVVIVNYNVRDLLMNAIASLKRAMEGIDGEIIVVDNASTDGAMEAIRTEHPDVIAIPLDRNLGFGAGNNVGIERARGEYILLINPDTIVEEENIREMLGFMRDHPRAAVAGCKILLPDGSFDPVSKRGFPTPWSSFARLFGLAKLFPKSKLFGGYNLTWLDPNTETQVDALAGCYMFFRGDLLKELGGFDTDYFMYGEDLDLSWRVRQSGWEVWYNPSTSIIHVKGESTRRSSLDAIAMFYDAMEIFARKHFKRRALIPIWLIRLGIGLRRGLARFRKRFPHAALAVIDVLAVLIGLTLGQLLRTGRVLFTEYAYPEILIVPPLVFVVSIAAAGGYGADYGRLTRTLLGYLIGFFILSTLPYFFEEYRFSRGIVLATTGVGAALGLVARFVLLLHERTFGDQSARRVAFISREPVGRELRDRARRTFLGKPVAFIGVIAPRFEMLDRIGDRGLGTIENIHRIIREQKLTDIFMVDRDLSYAEVVRAASLAGGDSARFHLVRSDDLGIADSIRPKEVATSAPEPYRHRTPLLKRLRDRLAAFALLLVTPILALFGWKAGIGGNALAKAAFGGRPLVGGSETDDPDRGPVFTATALYADEELSPDEREEIDRYYAANSSFLLDCEIIVSTFRFGKRKREEHGVAYRVQSTEYRDGG